MQLRSVPGGVLYSNQMTMRHAQRQEPAGCLTTQPPYRSSLRTVSGRFAGIRTARTEKPKFDHVSPPSLQVLQQAVLDIFQQSSTGIPLPMLRAALLSGRNPSVQNSSVALAGYPTLAAQIERPEYNREDLIRSLAWNEEDAYLLAHIMALETAIKTPQQRVKINSDRHPLIIQRAIEDAEDVVDTENRQPLYGKDKTRIADNLYRLILASPKVLLHEHYRGCSPLALVRARAVQWRNKADFGQDKEGLREKARAENVAPFAYEKTHDLQEICRTDRVYSPDGQKLLDLSERSLNYFRETNDNIVSQAIYSTRTAYLGAYLYTLKQGLDNVRYFEYRLNPISNVSKDPIFNARAIQQGLDDAREFLKRTRGIKVDCNLIFSADRQPKEGTDNLPPRKNPHPDKRVDLALRVLETAIEARQQGVRVTGFDIQGDEVNYAITDFKPVSDMLKAYNTAVAQQLRAGTLTEDRRIGATLHAGETPVSGLISHKNRPLTGAESVEKSIDLFWHPNTPVRIGHGIAIAGNPRLIAKARQLGIGLEQCLKSNVQTGAVDYYRSHPAFALSKPVGERTRVGQPGQGLLVSLSTDNATTCNDSATNIGVKAACHGRAGQVDRQKFQMDGIKTAFIFDKTKQSIESEMRQTYSQLQQSPEFSRVIEQEADDTSFLKLIRGQAI